MNRADVRKSREGHSQLKTALHKSEPFQSFERSMDKHPQRRRSNPPSEFANVRYPLKPTIDIACEGRAAMDQIRSVESSDSRYLPNRYRTLRHEHEGLSAVRETMEEIGKHRPILSLLPLSIKRTPTFRSKTKSETVPRPYNYHVAGRHPATRFDSLVRPASRAILCFTQ